MSENESDNEYMVEFTEDAFVSVVEQYPIIYDKSRPDYKNIAKKDNAWGSIAEIMNCSVEHCQKTWGSLVAKYRRERKQKNTPPTSGSGYTKKTEWPLFEALNFMDKHIQMRRTFTNVNIPNKLDGNTSSNETPEENVEITPHCEPLIQSETPQIPREFQRSNTLSSQTESDATKKKRKKDALEDIIKTSACAMSNYLTNKVNTEFDEDIQFTNSIALMLKRMNRKKKIMCKSAIMALLVEYESD